MIKLIVFIFVTLIVCAVGLLFPESKYWEFFGILDTASAIALAVLAGIVYYEYMKDEDEIELKFEVIEDSQKRIVSFEEITKNKLLLLRKDINIAEILGVLGMINKSPSSRYEIDKTLLFELLKRIREIQKGKGNELLIPILEKNFKEHFE